MLDERSFSHPFSPSMFGGMEDKKGENREETQTLCRENAYYYLDINIRGVERLRFYVKSQASDCFGRSRTV